MSDGAESECVGDWVDRSRDEEAFGAWTST